MRGLVGFILALMVVIGSISLAAPGLAQDVPLSDLLPGYAEGGSTLTVTNEASRTLDEHAAGFTDPAEAARLLTDWGWQENVFRHYEDTARTGVGATRPYLYVSLTRFQDAGGASAALPYVAQDLGAEIGHRELPMPSPLGDESRQFSAPIEGGSDLTLYVRSGTLLLRISTLLSDGVPVFDPIQVADGILARQAAPPTPAVMQPSLLPQLLETLPPDLPPCLSLVGEGDLDVAALVERFPTIPGAPEQLAVWGWDAGAYRQFRCDVPPSTGVHWIELGIHRFKDADSAAAAVPYFAQARTVGTQLAEAPAMQLGNASAAIAGPSEVGTELTLYLSTGRLLLRVTGIAVNADPRADTELVMTALFLLNAAGRDEPTATEPVPPSIVIPTPIPSFPSPTPVPLPRPTATAMPVPTVPPPMPTPLPPPANCDPSYPDVCIPPPPPDLDCGDISAGRFVVLPPDPHNFDGPKDGSDPNEPDGIGCELN